MSSIPIPFSTTIDQNRGTTRVVVSGEFDGAAVATFDEATHPINLAKARLVIVDLAAAELIDSAGISALMRFRQRFDEIDTELRILAPRPFQIRLFEITGLSHILYCEESVPE